MILDTVNRKIEVLLGEAKVTNDCPIVAAYFDSKGPAANSGGPSLINSNGVTAVAAIPAPAANVIRQVNELTVQNADTVSHIVTVRYNDNATLYTIMKATLAPGYTLTYSKALGWAVMSPTGLFIAGQIPGTNTNDNAAAGMVGEYLTATPAAVNLTTATVADFGTLLLTPGDWSVDFTVLFSPSVGFSNLLAWLNTTSVTEPTRPSNGHILHTLSGTTVQNITELCSNRARFSIASNTTIYCSGRGDFASGTATAQAIINARRER